ncbi:hypothetical protein ASPZODRAFT_1055495 [Penicilliopsis zonata CBS 506.65]|uniref:WLM domain-containing protein n=1 Tax=Penicilliopsis zonata CBS 506.65 TaxID=1073090 RepID=A0A1L9SRN3_9EURO|nr:hypothetical protein ASPZODRAFT_1055495 [Penicilliopsis zonata CBS 506.65]OJJ49880.1 hypothetical protein ASPZODRAFT_1055495 [Penicilliopsis zonata CBS 506.65]
MGSLPLDTPDASMVDPGEMAITVHHHGKPHTLRLPADATLEDLTLSLASSLHIPVENQKLLVAPKPGMLKPPFAATPLDAVLPLASPRLKITLLGTPTQEIDELNAQVESARHRLAARRSSPFAAKPARTTQNHGIHTLSSSSSSSSSNHADYTFHRLFPLPHLPNPSRSLGFLTRLRDDPGIRFAMTKHRFSVPLLTEMDPAEHTTLESRTLGLNRNKGEAIELRLRTDAYDGYRDYRTIRKTLCHELAHCVFSEHDRHFWDLTAQIEREVERADWKSGGSRLSDQEFYNPADWEREQEEDHPVDERGWTGGQFVLGGGGAHPVQDQGASRRDILAKAAEERMKREGNK